VSCPLCAGARVTLFATVGDAPYLRCGRCHLTWLDPGRRPSEAAERARYQTHENDPADPRYRAFLSRLAEPLAARLVAGMEGLDYGAGPGPALAAMLTEAGFPMRVWDPFFAPDPAPLERSYDFITCTETAEHFFHPGREFRRLDDLLRRPGWLGLMTQVLEDDEGFGKWWYVRDPTHVSFYRPETLNWIAERHGWGLERPAPTVALFRKS